MCKIGLANALSLCGAPKVTSWYQTRQIFCQHRNNVWYFIPKLAQHLKNKTCTTIISPYPTKKWLIFHSETSTKHQKQYMHHYHFPISKFMDVVNCRVPLRSKIHDFFFIHLNSHFTQRHPFHELYHAYSPPRVRSLPLSPCSVVFGFRHVMLAFYHFQRIWALPHVLGSTLAPSRVT